MKKHYLKAKDRVLIGTKSKRYYRVLGVLGQFVLTQRKLHSVEDAKYIKFFVDQGFYKTKEEAYKALRKINTVTVLDFDKKIVSYLKPHALTYTQNLYPNDVKFILNGLVSGDIKIIDEISRPLQLNLNDAIHSIHASLSGKAVGIVYNFAKKNNCTFSQMLDKIILNNEKIRFK